jgi:RES domain-containing protein
VPESLWRIGRRSFALDRLGSGARAFGGRWNLVGTPVIYASRTIAVAALESFVHAANVVPKDLVLARLALPDGYSSERPSLTSLPSDWNTLPPGPGSMNFGTRWVQEGRSLVLYVPSVIIREDVNGVINPHHPEFATVDIAIEREFQYDPRLFARS